MAQAAGPDDVTGEQARFTRAMGALFHPKRLAIVGATPRQGFAYNIQREILDGGYRGEIFGVTPRHTAVLGSPCYPTLDAIPGGVDAAIVVVPSQLVLDVLGQAEHAGVAAVNIITSGFGEQGDGEAHQRQAAIRAFAQRTGIRVVGPNCLGLISTPANMTAIWGPYGIVPRGPVGLVFQSGLLAYCVVMPSSERGFGFSYIATTGNEADLDAADFIRYYVEDDETRVIGCFIEQFRDPQKFLRVAALAAERQKPIVALKIGRSEGGRRAAQAHTGSLVGSSAIADALMRQYGVVRVANLDEMNETLAVFHARRLPRGSGVGAIFSSGGACGLVSDLGHDLGIALPQLAPHTVEKLQSVIPDFGTIGNPLDVTGQAASRPEITEGAFVALAEDPNIHTIIYGQACPERIDLATPVGEVLRMLPGRYPDKLFLLTSFVGGRMREGQRYGQDPAEPVMQWDGIPFLQGAENALRAVRSLIWYAEFQRERREGGHLSEHFMAGASAVADEARARVAAAGGKPLVERAAKEILALYGIPVTRETLATTAEAAVAAAQAIGYPIVLKIESPDIAHKTEAGGVLLDVRDDAAVRSGFATIVAQARRHKPDAQIAGVLVQELVTGGRELILGMTQDPAYGPVVAVGLGGVFVEVLRDIALGVPPLTDHDSRAMLARLRGATILDGTGARGAAPADTDAVVAILGQFSRLCLDLGDRVQEIDINPLLVFDRDSGRGGARVVDCLIVPATNGAS